MPRHTLISATRSKRPRNSSGYYLTLRVPVMCDVRRAGAPAIVITKGTISAIRGAIRELKQRIMHSLIEGH